MSDPTLVVISGMSGSGKSTALRCFEDLGHYCVDNLPPPLIPTFVDLCRAASGIDRAALVVDVRTRDFLQRFAPIWEQLRRQERGRVRLLFLDADDSVLLQRFSETRRPHPLATSGTLKDGVKAERELLGPVRELADDVVDTSQFNVHGLRDFLGERFGDTEDGGLTVQVVSFAYRNGLVENADLVFDVRFLPNPHYDPELRPLTGLDKPVREFIESRPETQEFLQRTGELLRFLLPHYEREGKSYLTLAFGCTGGRHRSVAVAARVAAALQEHGYPASVSHADLQMSSTRTGSR